MKTSVVWVGAQVSRLQSLTGEVLYVQARLQSLTGEVLYVQARLQSLTGEVLYVHGCRVQPACFHAHLA